MAGSRQHEEHDKKENAMGVERSEGHGHCVCVRERESEKVINELRFYMISDENGYD